MTIYIYGCSTCGVNAQYIRKVKAHSEVEVINTKYDKVARQEHANYLRLMGLDLSTYSPIVVDGDKVTLLRLWQP